VEIEAVAVIGNVTDAS